MDENKEHRREVRIELREPLMASAEVTGTCFPAELIDLSKSGAKFRFPECKTPLEIKQGHETGWTVCLPSGKLKRFKASARWFRRLPNEYVIGVEFLEAIKATLFQELLGDISMLA
jgi:hypothetical protein